MHNHQSLWTPDGYLPGIPLAYFSTCAALAVYVLVAALRFLPDRRIEAHFKS